MPSDGPAVEGVDVDGATGGCYRWRMAAPVSEADREYFRRLGRYKDESNAMSDAAHRARPLWDRVKHSFDWCSAMMSSVRHDVRDDDDPGHFYELARARGLVDR